MGDELERMKQWAQRDRLGRPEQEDDTSWAVEANENFYMQHFKKPFQRDKVVSDVAKFSFHGFEEYVWESLYWRRLNYAVLF